MDKEKSMRKSKNAAGTQKEKKKKLSPSTKLKNIHKKFQAEIVQYVRTGAEAKRKNNLEKSSLESEETDPDYAEFLKTYDPNKESIWSDSSEPEPTDVPVKEDHELEAK
jgi:hypothetical protein